MGTSANSVVDLPLSLPLGFRLDDVHLAHEPPEARGATGRDDVRLMVSRGDDDPVHARFTDLPGVLSPGDLVVVNTSATVPAAVDAVLVDGALTAPFVLHVSTELPGGLWMVEPRSLLAGGSTVPLELAAGPHRAVFGDGTVIDLLRPAPGSRRLWLAMPSDDGIDLLAVLARCGRAIRYPYVERDWPIATYQTVFAVEPGSAEMPSAARPFTADDRDPARQRGVGVATITLHTGVSSLEGHELPYPERFLVPPATAALVNATHAVGGHVIAVGTTVVRALESVVDDQGTVHPGGGWTDASSHRAGRPGRRRPALRAGTNPRPPTWRCSKRSPAGERSLPAYEAAWAGGYLWHEFGDSHLLLPYAGSA